MPLNHTNGFKTPFLKMRHYQDHIIVDNDFPCASADDYEEMADDFLGKPVTTTMRVYVRRYRGKAGDVIRWDTATDEFGVKSASGDIVTYFKVNYAHGTNEDYFNLQIAKDVP